LIINVLQINGTKIGTLIILSQKKSAGTALKIA
jgi:hypothetical protein